jgi:uncharacterized protein YbaP (TraB family)
MRYLYSVIIAITIIFIIFASVVFLLLPGIETDEGEELEVTKNPLLWRIEGENPSYLYGSIHLADEGIVTLPDVVIDSFDSCDVIYTEIKLDAETLAKSAQESTLHENVTLFDLLPEDVENKFNSYIESKGFSDFADLLNFSSYKVWFAATSLPVLENFESLIRYLPLDYYIWNLAIINGKDARGLEPVELQIDIFDTLTLEEQIKLLNDTLDILIEFFENDRSLTELYISSYLKGDLPELQNLSFIGYEVDDPLYNKMINRVVIDRNYNMSEDISNLIKNNPQTQYFFTIGSGHFYGDEGLIKLLEDEGFTVTRVQFNTSESCDSGEIMINQRCYEPYVTK